jgi:hypothetical protein
MVLMLHALILYFLLAGHHDANRMTAVRYSQLVFISPPLARPVVKRAELPRLPALTHRPGKPAVKLAPLPDEPVSSLIQTPAIAERQGRFGEPARMNIDSLIKQAGKADRETRSTGEMQAIGPASDSMETVMTRAFTAAKLAVPLKWYEAARIELFSAPNDTRRIYQVNTAFGTYCLYYPDTMRDQGGAAGSGQPTMSTCPKRFGAGAR